MKAIVNTPGGPAITAVDDPRPGGGEALVAVRAFSVNRGELDLLQTRTGGWRPGQDIAGVVVEPAADGAGPAAGTRVVALVEQAGWAELAAVPVARLAPLPAGAGLERAAALPLAGLTALRTLRLAGSLLGRRVLVTGANGGVGRIQIQLAATAGAQVTAVARPQHEKQLLALGASSVVADPAAAGGLYDLVADWVGGPSLAGAIAKAAPRGTVVLGSGNTEKTPISIHDFFGHEGARLVSYLSYAYPEPPGPDLTTLAVLVADGRLDPGVNLTLPWTRLRDALTALAGRPGPPRRSGIQAHTRPRCRRGHHDHRPGMPARGPVSKCPDARHPPGLRRRTCTLLGCKQGREKRGAQPQVHAWPAGLPRAAPMAPAA